MSAVRLRSSAFKLPFPPTTTAPAFRPVADLSPLEGDDGKKGGKKGGKDDGDDLGEAGSAEVASLGVHPE